MKPSKDKHPGAVELGKLGGRAGRGKAKARPSEQMRAAARKRWDKVHNRPQSNADTQL